MGIVQEIVRFISFMDVSGTVVLIGTSLVRIPLIEYRNRSIKQVKKSLLLSSSVNCIPTPWS